MPAPVWRVQDRESFIALRRSGTRSRSGPLRLTWLPAGPELQSARPRLAIAAGRSVGGAVVRNRLRRRLRSLVGEAASAGGVAPGTYLIAADTLAATLSYGELRNHLMTALSALDARAALGARP